MKRWWTSLIIRERQIKTSQLLEWPLSRRCEISVGKDWRTGKLCAPMVGMEISTATWKTVQKFIRKLNRELPSDPTSGYKSGGNKVGIMKRSLQPMFMAKVFTAVNSWKQSAYLSVGEWVEKILSHIHNGITFCYKTEGTPATYDNGDELGGHHMKSDRERQILYVLTCGKKSKI